jgi:hypothetical protein
MHHGESFRTFSTSFWFAVNFFVCRKSAAHSAQQAPVARRMNLSMIS